jgi:2-keto-4-pentenoate hydratase/2-oxohepta-3-ene-1,7-dioic acid hydratase in catechol pathway
MRVLRVRYQDKTFYASLIGDVAYCLNRSLGLDYPIALRELLVLPPVAPTKVVCVSANYRTNGGSMIEPAAEEPSLFLKPPSAVIGSGQPIVIPRQSARVDCEGELAIIVGKTCRNCPPTSVAEHLFGYCCANDVTACDLKQRDRHLGRAKAFDTFAPIGPWIETHVDNPSDLAIKTYVNGQVRQQGNTSQMVIPPFDLVSYISRVMTLNPGDVIMTGTPTGVGSLSAGDEVRVEIAGIGLLINQAIHDGPEIIDTPIQ